MKVKTLFKTLLLASAFAGMMGAAQAETLKFASEAPRSDTQFQGGEKFSEILKAKTGGALDLKVFPDSSLGKFDAAISGVRGGTIRLLPVDSKAEAKRSRLLSS